MYESTAVQPPIDTLCMACDDATCHFKPIKLQRRPLSDTDVLIDMMYCGVCHSDLHTAASHMAGVGRSVEYPVVPGHELVGIVEAVGSSVSKFKVGDHVGVGCLVDACLECDKCDAGEEQKCSRCVGSACAPAPRNATPPDLFVCPRHIPAAESNHALTNHNHSRAPLVRNRKSDHQPTTPRTGRAARRATRRPPGRVAATRPRWWCTSASASSSPTATPSRRPDPSSAPASRSTIRSWPTGRRRARASASSASAAWASWA